MYTVTQDNERPRTYKTARAVIAYLNTLVATQPVIVACPDGEIIDAPAVVVAFDLYMMEA